jgi:hypothetical protein
MPKVDLSHYKGREPAYIKHCLLEEYLPDLAYKVGSKWDSLAYIDGFAGPWQSNAADYADSSFGIAVEALRQCQIGLRATRKRELPIECILVDQDRIAFSRLQKFAAENTQHGFGVHALNGDFVENIPVINQILRERIQNPFRFIFLDPKGWADIPMLEMKPFLKGRSHEVLINLMTRHIIRFLDEPDRAASYNNLFGREGVLDTLCRESLKRAPAYERAAEAVREYGKSLRDLCGFKYVSSAVILEPDEFSIRYFLVYASNHPMGIEVFKAAEIKAATLQETVRYETQVRKTKQPALVFDNAPPSSRLSSTLRTFYSEMAKEKIGELFRESRAGAHIPYADVFCEAMAYPLFTPRDLVSWLETLEPGIRLVPQANKKVSHFKYDSVLVVNPQR